MILVWTLAYSICDWGLISQPKKKTPYVEGTQKNRLNEMVLLSTQSNMFKLMGKKIMANLQSNWTCDICYYIVYAFLMGWPTYLQRNLASGSWNLENSCRRVCQSSW